MKLTNIIISCGVVISASILAVSCVKDKGKEVALESTSFNNSSFVQVYNAALGSSRNYVYVDGAPINGAALAYGGSLPASTPANFAIVSGLKAFLIRDTLAATTQPALSLAINLNPATNYTLFMYDTVNSVKNKLVVNNIIVPADTTSRIRFANFAYSPFPITAVDVFSTRLATNIFTNVNVTDVTGYIAYDSRRSDTLYLRPTGTATNILNNNGTVAAPNYQPLQIIIAPVRKRSYTVVLRGSFRTDLTSSTTSRTLSFVPSN